MSDKTIGIIIIIMLVLIAVALLHDETILTLKI